jgi:hypothetical protein
MQFMLMSSPNIKQPSTTKFLVKLNAGNLIRVARAGQGVSNKKGGPKCCLSESQEEEFCEVILQMEASLYGLIQSDICSVMYKFCEKNGIENKFNTKIQKAGKKWFRGFIERPKSHRAATVNTSASCQGKKVRRVAHASIVSSSPYLKELQEAKQTTLRGQASNESC